MKLGIRIQLVALGAIAVAVLLAGNLNAPRQVQANIDSPEGVLCFELTGLATAIGLVRIDHNTVTDEITFSSQVYIQDTDTVPSCQDPQDAVPGDAVPFPEVTADRPALEGDWVNASDTITAVVCQEDLNFGPLNLAFAEVDVNFPLLKAPLKSGGTFTLRGPYTDDTCTTQDANFIDVDVVVVGAKFLDGPGGDPATFTSDWDKDGLRDWDELAPGLPACSDPFQTKNCENVGGVAELADVATTPLEAADSSSNTGLIAAIAAAAVIGVAAVGGVAVFARRRQE